VRNFRTGLVVVGLLSGALASSPVGAASENLPWTDGGAGPSDYQVQVDSVCSFPAIGFRDNVDNGFDHGGVFGFAGLAPVGSGATTVDVTTSGTDSIVTYSETNGDYTVDINYRFTDDNIVRTLVAVTNNGAVAATALPMALAYDHGDTFTVRSVDGGTWRNSGNWFTMSETGVASGVFDNYKAVFHLPDGPGTPESTASVGECAGAPVSLGAVSEYITYVYLMDIPAGETRRLVVYNGIDPTADGVATKAATFASSLPSPGSGLLGDLSAEDACTVVNWVFAGCSSGGESPSYDIDLDHYLQRSDLPDTL
jgi:hypothetical protein